MDGTAPGVPTSSVCKVDTELLVGAAEQIKEVTFVPKAPIEASAACVVEDLDVEENTAGGLADKLKVNAQGSRKSMIYKESQLTSQSTEAFIDMARSPIKEANGWALAPTDAKEFTILLSGGLIRRPALILKNDDGVYDTVAVYKKKKDTEPMAVLPLGKMVVNVVDDAIKNDKTYRAVRNMRVLKLDPEGKTLTMHISAAMDIENDTLWHPKRLHKEVTENVGYVPGYSMQGRQDDLLIAECMLPNWSVVGDWQADAIHYLIEKENIDVVFSHFHNVDIQSHMFIKHLADREFNRNPVSVAESWMEKLYIQTDEYLGKFLHFLDEGWTVLIFSDHAQVASKHKVPMLTDANGIVTPIFEELGFTKTKDDGHGGREIDWEHTKAVCQREGHVYLNLKGRNQHTLADGTVIDGIVDPKDQYELEEEIMTAVYGYKDPETGHRICSIALRNRDAVLLGQGGPEAGDLIIWHAEGYNFDHADCISTTYGEGDTSVSPIFIAAGEGLKKGFETDRIIRQIDFAATVAALGGVRMPAQCEGAPVYQILEKEF